MRPSLPEDLWRTYALDAADALRAIEESLLGMEGRRETPEELNRLYRALHTLKGNSAVMGLSTIEELSHAAEDMIGLVRDRGVATDPEMLELLLQTTDCLSQLTARASGEQRDVERSLVAELVENVRGWTLAHGGAEQRTSAIGRGEVVVWSTVPPSPAEAASGGPMFAPDDQVSLEIFLCLARDTLERLLPAIEEQLLPADVALQMAHVSDLRDAAERAGHEEVVRCTEALFVKASEQERASMLEALSELCAALDGIERGYRKQAEFPQSFGLDRYCERCARALADCLAKQLGHPVSLLRPSSQPTVASESVRGAEVAPIDGATQADFLRVDARKVSLLMDLTGEIALACSAVTHHPELEGTSLEGFATAAHKLQLLIRELQHEVSGLRLVPVSGVFQRMKRVVRDTAKRTGKKVDLTLIGEDTEVDKVMVDCLHDPLVHMLRNAIDHGIELPEERRAAGKPEVGRIVLEAGHEGGEVSVRITDDGRGINRTKVVARAVERKLIASGASLTDEQITSLLFLPGFSTKETVDTLSGRGVGMDVVKTTLERLRGRVQLRSVEGQGSTFSLTVPLTLAFMEAMIVSDGPRLFALPIEKVYEVFRAEPQQLRTNSADGESLVRVRDRLIPVLWLSRFFGEPVLDERLEGRVIVAVQTSRGALALPVDRLHGNQPIMLKPLRGLLSGVRAAAGCGMLRTGDVALAIDCEQLHV
jgi:two-component system, chemotaxis family, sensor kinase CheA